MGGHIGFHRNTQGFTHRIHAAGAGNTTNPSLVIAVQQGCKHTIAQGQRSFVFAIDIYPQTFLYYRGQDLPAVADCAGQGGDRRKGGLFVFGQGNTINDFCTVQVYLGGVFRGFMDSIAIRLAAGITGADELQRRIVRIIIGIILQDPGSVRPIFHCIRYHTAGINFHAVPQGRISLVPIPVGDPEKSACFKLIIIKIDIVIVKILTRTDNVGIVTLNELRVFSDIGTVVQLPGCNNRPRKEGQKYTEAQQ